MLSIEGKLKKSPECALKDLIIVPTSFDSFSDEPNGDPSELDQNVEETPQVSEAIETEAPDVPEFEPEPALHLEGAEDPLLSTLPPEARGETNGGPLGCCLGTVAGLFLTLAVILLISIGIGNGGYLGWATGPTALLGMIIGGYVGWRIGKRIYREYELSPQRKERLDRVEQEWRAREKRSKRVRRTKIG
jgi:hypothetical protein